MRSYSKEKEIIFLHQFQIEYPFACRVANKSAFRHLFSSLKLFFETAFDFSLVS